MSKLKLIDAKAIGDFRKNVKKEAMFSISTPTAEQQLFRSIQEKTYLARYCGAF